MDILSLPPPPLNLFSQHAQAEEDNNYAHPHCLSLSLGIYEMRQKNKPPESSFKK